VAGQVAWLRGDYASAAAHHQHSRKLWESLGDQRGVALALNSLGNVSHYQGDYQRAEELYRQSLEVHRHMGNRVGSAAVLNSLGVLARNRGNLDGARAFGEQALEIHRELGDTRNVALVLNNLARVERDASQWTNAVSICAESLGLFRDLTDAWGVSTVLVNLGIMAQQTEDRVLATRLFGAAEALRETATGSAFLSVSPSELAAHEDSALAARSALGEAEFAANWQKGRSLSLDEAVAAGLAIQQSQSVRRGPLEFADPLAAREREVAILVASGHTNRQIGEALVISEWTVDTHVRHILAKLGLRSRAQVAAWAVERRLVGR
jgi:non-specific serine/threonine protein kinase